MSASIPPNVIQEVRERANLLDIVQKYVRLERRGRRWVGLCPFHSEKTPSFGVSPQKQLFHCFGCQVGGDLFAFVMRMEALSFPEAVRKLAAECGVDVPKPKVSAREAKDRAEREAQWAANRSAEAWFCRHLSPETVAWSYLTLDRGLNPETIERFAIGFSPDDWDALPRCLLAEGLVEAAISVGLLSRRQRDGGTYSRFRKKVMFPIRAPDGKVVAFGARRADWLDADGPKYLNSPESGIYDKSSVLYGLYEGQKSIRQLHRAILVEGYFDVIALHQAGLEEAVAACGTALTARHAGLLRKWVNEVILAYDADAAGHEAILKSALPLLSSGLDVRVIELPAGEDPDSYVRRNGGSAFQALVDTAPSVFDDVVRRVRARSAGGGIAGATQAVEQLVPLLRSISEPLKREVATETAASALGVPTRVLTRHLHSPIPGGSGDGRIHRADAGSPSASSIPRRRVAPETPVRHRAQGPGAPPKTAHEAGFGVSPVEAAILRTLLDRPDEMIHALERRKALDALSSTAFEAAVGDLVEVHRSGNRLTGPSILERVFAGDTLSASDQASLRGKLMEDLPNPDDPDELTKRWVKQRREAQLKALRLRIERAHSPDERRALEAELLEQASQILAS